MTPEQATTAGRLTTCAALVALVTGCTTPGGMPATGAAGVASPSPVGVASPGAAVVTSPPPAGAPTASPAAAVSDDVAAAGQAAADALRADRELDDFTYMAIRRLSAGAYTLAQAGAGGGTGGGAGTGMGGMGAGAGAGLGGMGGGVGAGTGAGLMMGRPDRATRLGLGERHAAMMTRAQARQDAMGAVAAAIAAALEAATWTDNGDGTRTRVVAFTVPADQATGAPSRDVRMTLTIDAETGVLVASKHEATLTFASGVRRELTRELAVQADGAYQVAMTMIDTEPDGATRTTTWSVTIAVDGSRSGSGTTVWKDGNGTILRTVEHDLAGTYDLPRLDCRMTGLGALASVSLPWDGAIQASLRDRTSGALVPGQVSGG